VDPLAIRRNYCLYSGESRVILNCRTRQRARRTLSLHGLQDQSRVGVLHHWRHVEADSVHPSGNHVFHFRSPRLS
jgi:hypothetical protein